MLERAKHLRLRHRPMSTVIVHETPQSAGRGDETSGTVRDVLVAARGRLVVLAAVVSVMAACSADSPASPEVRAGAVYDSIVRWFAQADAADPEPLPVFIEPRGEGASIELDVQAELIKSTQDVATVRFIDSRDEALVTNDDGTVVVADGGILVRLAPVVEEGNKVRLDIDVHELDEVFRTLQFDLSQVGDKWVIDQPPVDIPSG
jgi:hypothetical protein